MAPKFVVPYRLSGKRGKNDAADAAAICEAVQRPNMRFVPVKTEAQQAQLCVHRTLAAGDGGEGLAERGEAEDGWHQPRASFIRVRSTQAASMTVCSFASPHLALWSTHTTRDRY